MAKLEVIRDLCIGCGACGAIDETLFELDDEGIAVAKITNVEADLIEAATDAVNACPTSAITLAE